ncbi:MAG TPA: phospholipase D family protein [Pseudonocardia sp.]|uniref:phospholipase D-like domain-containing protein n=1 Tax=Pseudonocardia sp. TaxID=60912 RepID=UPI002B887B25|nr:phospholipase D family protein [Pseudonocardia sp.]HTF54854.1 phospholipase D family protein [Pseudonocardia sp.]
MRWSWLDAADRRVGDALERVLMAHHARRLRRLGWGEVLESDRAGDRYAAGRPPSEGNEVEVLVDGTQAIPAMVEAITNARSHVYIAAWHASADFEVVREPGPTTLRELLSEAAQRVPVRVLMWAGPPVPLFEPTRRRAKKACDGLSAGTGVRCVLDSRGRSMHCHHEKLLVVDDEVAFVGGIDFTALEGDRHDSNDHPPDRELGWHDLAVRLRGPVVADVAQHFRQRWVEVAREPLPEPEPPPAVGRVTAQLVRTVPERTYKFAPRGEFSILDAYLRALRSTRSLIYLENQFLWSPEITEVLVDKLRHPPTDRFRLVLLLPRRPTNGADTTRGQLGRLIAADGGASRLVAATINAHGPGTSVPVYVHAKVAVVDDEWLTIGSANLNEHSMFNDTEVNVVVGDPDLARATRLRLWSEHLQRPESELVGDPADLVDNLWRPLAEEQSERERAGLPPTHRLSLLPGVSRRTARLGGPLRGLLVDG